MTKILDILIVSLVAVGILVACGNDVSEQGSTYELTAEQMVTDYKNELAADVKYRGKVVTITGVVRDIGYGEVSIQDVPYVEFKGAFLTSVECRFKQKELPKVAPLVRGQTLTAKPESTDGQGWTA